MANNVLSELVSVFLDRFMHYTTTASVLVIAISAVLTVNDKVFILLLLASTSSISSLSSDNPTNVSSSSPQSLPSAVTIHLRPVLTNRRSSEQGRQIKAEGNGAHFLGKLSTP